MIALDTNVVVRLLVADDQGQFDRATALVRDNKIFLGLTVLLEAEWVLRSAYKCSREQVAAAFTSLAGLSNVTVEQPSLLVQAIAAHRDGIDFADALHVLGAAAAGVDAFATFDKGIGQRWGLFSQSLPLIDA